MRGWILKVLKSAPIPVSTLQFGWALFRGSTVIVLSRYCEQYNVDVTTDSYYLDVLEYQHVLITV